MLAVTGADGFVGSALCLEAAARGIRVRTLTRRGLPCPGAAEHRGIGDLADATIAAGLFDEVDTVIHCAAKVHMMERAQPDDTDRFRRVNRDGTLALARAALAAGVKRFIFLSTIKVLGESTTGRPFQHDDPPAPAGDYAISKAEAELGLRDLVQGTPMELVIVRLPLVHGPGAGGNLAILLRLLRSRMPLPFRNVRNRRAVLGLENLVDALLYAASSPAAAGEIVLLRDDVSLSTPEIITALAEGLGVRAHLLPVPERWLRLVARIVGREAYAARLIDSLDVSLDHTITQVGWSPRVPAREGLRRAAQAARSA